MGWGGGYLFRGGGHLFENLKWEEGCLFERVPIQGNDGNSAFGFLDPEPSTVSFGMDNLEFVVIYNDIFLFSPVISSYLSI